MSLSPPHSLTHSLTHTGGVSDWHALLIPIECVSTRAQLSAAAARDLTSYQNALQRHFLTRNLACLRFERALRTQGQRNHMQVHVVPLTEQQASEAISVFLALCGHHKVTFHEIPVSYCVCDWGSEGRSVT